jgi:hypothetical protein
MRRDPHQCSAVEAFAASPTVEDGANVCAGASYPCSTPVLQAIDSAVVRSLRPLLRRLALSRVGAVGLFAVALAVYAVQAIAWPLSAGRDGSTYLIYYAEMWHAHAVFPELMLLRTPVAPLLLGPLFQLGGSTLAEIGLGICFAASVVAISAAAASISGGLAVAAALVVLAYPSNGALFHEYSSDPVAALGIALLLLATVRVAQRPTMARFALLGALTVILVLVRPVNQVLLVLALLPLALPGSWRSRLLRVGAFAAASAVLLGAWASYNRLRYDDLTVARSGAAQIPLNRAFRVERIVSPDNGPVSRELGVLVRRHLLAEEPYRSYGITEEQFYASGSSRMYYDLLVLSDQVWGWHSDYAKLRRAGVEAVRSHPRLYVWAVGRTVWDELVTPYSKRSAQQPGTASGATRPAETIVVGGRRLPKPSDGEPIPGQRLFWLFSTPDGRIWMDWSDVAHPVARYRYASDRAQAEAVERQVAGWERDVPNRNGVASLSSRLNGISSTLPPALVWLLLGLPSLLLWRLPEVRALIAVTGASLLVIGVTALGEPTTLEFALPFQPIFILFGLTGMLSLARLLRAARPTSRRT